MKAQSILSAAFMAPFVVVTIEAKEPLPSLPCHAVSNPTCTWIQMPPQIHFPDEPEHEPRVQSAPQSIASHGGNVRWVPYPDHWVPSHEEIHPLHRRNMIAAILGGETQERLS